MNSKQISKENDEYTGNLTQGGVDKRGHEVYGEKPKMFSQEWWPYFWDYYKIHTLVAVVAIALIGMTIHQMLTRKSYDATVVFVGKSVEADATPLEAVAEDVTGNGKVEVMLEAMDFSQSEAKDEYSIALSQRFMIEISEGEGYLYIIPKNLLETYGVSDGEDNGVFMTTDEWLTSSVEDDKLVTINGVTYGVDVSDNKVLKSCGIDTQDKVLCIRSLFERMQEKNGPLHKNAITMANKILE